MKKIILVLVLVFIMAIPFLGFSDTGTLSTPYSIQPTEAASIDWDFNLGTNANMVTGRHRWKAADGSVIYLPNSARNGWISWTLKNYQIDSIPETSNRDCTGFETPAACCIDVNIGSCDDMEYIENTDCIAAGDPSPCCTNENTGVCTGWSDTALFDCGSSACDDYILGVGLRTLIMIQWKRVYCLDCTITF